MQYMRLVKGRGISCTFISHRLKEVIANADRIVVMRDGATVAEAQAAASSEEQLVDSMGVVSQATPEAPGAETIASIETAGQSGRVRVALRPSPRSEAQFIARAGEVVGLAGLDGHGQRDTLLRAFAAAQHPQIGAEVHGSIAYVSGDRHRDGVFPLWSVGRNLTVGLMRKLAKYGFLDPNEEDSLANEWRDSIRIKTPDIGQPILSLSGGNQQKVLIARALASGAEIVLLDDPMRGVDVGTKREMFAEMRRDARKNGKCFLLYTTETRELENCDRAYVFYRGAITEEIERASLTEDRVLRASFAEVNAHVE